LVIVVALGLALIQVVAAGAQEQLPAQLTLTDCIRVALERNPQLKASQQSVVSAAAGVTQARSGYYPQLSLRAGEGAAGSDNKTATGATGSSDGADVTLDMTLWRSGRMDAVGQSQASLRAAEWSHYDARQALVEQVAGYYYAVLAARELVAVAQAGVDAAQQHQQQVERQIEAGAAPEADIYTVNDDLAQARLTLIDARSQARVNLAQLKFVMGIHYTTDVQLAPATMSADESLPTEAEAVQMALARRPDLLASTDTVQARRYALAQARANRGPSLEVGGQYNRGYSDWGDGASSWDVTAAMTWPLSDGGYTGAAYTAARAGLHSSKADLQTLTNQIALEVQTALIELERTVERIKAGDEAVAAARSRLRTAEVKYREGLGILIEVTDARAALTSAEAANVSARFDHQVARIGLQRALGTLSLPDEGAEAPQ